ncbi:MAG TPA: PorP/SprF family type IX secretion system membrane protein [Flavobacteriaceae bacterium]|nr:PorP/SprF family type IX secretion system membrane protein [Flavobacteriaceae bacterium]
MKKITPIIFLMFCVHFLFSQENFIPTQHLPAQNFLQYNQFLFNPAFSRIGKEQHSIFLFNRRQWSGFEGAPNIYMLNYSAKINQKKGIGASIFQQNNGVLTYFGAYLNFSYGIQFSEKTWLTVGANIGYFQSGIDEDAYTNQPDPALLSINENSAFSFQPGINLTIGKLNIGVYAENLAVYNFTSESSLEEEKRISGHILFISDFYKNTYYKLLARARNDELQGMNYGGNALFGLSGLGWAQLGYDSFYGGSAGIGIEITKNLTACYLIEKDISGALSNFGTTHEFLLAFNFSTPQKKTLEPPNIKPRPVLEKVSKTYGEDDLKKLQAQIDVNRKKREAMKKRLDSLIKLDSLSKIEKKEPKIIPKEKPAQKPKAKEEEKTWINTYDKADFIGAEEGYYIIVNVFSRKDYRDLFLKALREMGFEPGSFQNKMSHYYYVYIKRFDDLDAAEASFKSKLNNRYQRRIWAIELK